MPASASIDAQASSSALPTSQLHCLADLGRRDAMIELGRRYEDGSGVAPDYKRAAALYGQAAAAIPPTTAIYSPPVKKGGNGRMIFLNNPNASPGSADAKYRLGRLFLTGRGVKLDQERGWKLIGEAAEQGSTDAARTLAERKAPQR